ncbi:MAG TPA: hypothetical protein VEI03_18380 [Stellaceae bacterium]|nr:hypothetical protein [Stellaceae bacterium]
MQIVPVQGVAQPVPTAAPTVVPLAGPATAAAPIEPARRVTANREGGRSDLQAQQQAQKAPQPQTRGRLIDLSV